MNKKLTKGSNKVLFGVCSGIAEYFDIDPVLVRLLFVCLVFCNGIGILPYFICALLMPSKW